MIPYNKNLEQLFFHLNVVRQDIRKYFCHLQISNRCSITLIKLKNESAKP